MVDRKAQITIAAGVLLIGVLGALAFRRSSEASPSPVACGESLELRGAIRPLAGSEPAVPALPRKMIEAETPRSPSATYLSPSEARQPPPFMAREFPGIGAPVGSDLPPLPRPSAAAPSVTLPAAHKIVDGDSLESLAEKYLGSAARAGEIYEANRDRLVNPGVLRIGAELIIPSPASAEASGTSFMPRHSLTPITSP